MSTEEFVNLIDEIRCALELLNENMERYFRIADPTNVTESAARLYPHANKETLT